MLLAALRNRMEFGPPKTEAGNRVVTLPAAARSALVEHLAAYVGKGPDALVFTGDKGAVLRSGNFRRAVGWSAALRAAGMPAGFHFHDLRHTGNNLAAATGASTRDLMHRMGHASMRAALIYQHANSERDREIAAGMDRRIAKQAKRAKPAAKRAKSAAKDGKSAAKGGERAATSDAKAGKTKLAKGKRKAPAGTDAATGTRMARKIKDA